jgi:hypothetical protein
MASMKSIARGVLFVVVTFLLSLVLVLVSWRIASRYSFSTPGDFVAQRFLPRLLPGDESLGSQAIVVTATDIACWFTILSASCWLIRRARSQR